MNILIAEDDESVARFLRQALAEAGHEVEHVTDGLKAFEQGKRGVHDLILLDVMMPVLDGLVVCEKLREANVSTPILIITAKDTLEDKVAGLDKGADDYIVKPFQLAELLARVRALLRRSNAPASLLTVGDLTLDPATRRAKRGEKIINLSATEYTLLEYLMRHAGRVVQRSALVEHVWQYDFKGNDNVLDVYVSYLRSKIDKGYTTPLIHTVRGVGYVIGVRDAS
jgi:DNA-binding response OmpR family regulator